MRHAADPEDGADDVVGGELPVAHLADAGDDRRERPQDRHELRQDDRLAAVPLVVLVRHPQVLAAEQQRVGPAVERLAGAIADLVAGGVADDRRRNQRQRSASAKSRSPRAANRPAVMSSESPGRKNPMSSPVSAKMISDQAVEADDADQLGDVVDV